MTTVAFEDFAERLARVREDIETAARSAGRHPEEVTLIAVTKGHAVEAMLTALEHGVLDLGESRIQDALPKMSALPPRARVHFIGRLQANKVNKAVGAFASIMAVDRDDLLDRVARRAEELGERQGIWLQVNVSGETQKGGCEPGDAHRLLDRALASDFLDLQGLMTMGRFDAGEAELRRGFARLRELGEALATRAGRPLSLSMGMSGDFGLAIEEGATHVRVGTALFGDRAPQGSGPLPEDR